MAPKLERMVRALASAYLYVQGVAGIAWWTWLLMDESATRRFWPQGTSSAAIWAFLLPDALLFVGASFLTARLLAAHSPQAERWGWLTIGGVGYATLYCLALAWLAPSTWLAALSMTTAFGCTILAVRAASSR